MKQYIVEWAYTGNSHVLLFEDGKLKSHFIEADYDLGGYINHIESQGYKKAYFAPKYEAEMQKAKEDYEFAIQEYEKAKQTPLILNNDVEVGRVKDIIHLE